jgi:hypothetical protein
VTVSAAAAGYMRPRRKCMAAMRQNGGTTWAKSASFRLYLPKSFLIG